MKRSEPLELILGGEAFSVVHVFDLDYRRQPKTQHYCCLCQRGIKTPKKQTQYLHFVDGGRSILSTYDEIRHEALSLKQPGGQFPGECGSFPVGRECARKLPRGFVREPSQAGTP